MDFGKVDTITSGVERHFTLLWTVLLPAVLVVVLALRKKPALPSLFVGAVAGAVVAIIVQDAPLHDVLAYMQGGYKLDSGIKEIDSLLNRGGIQFMIWLITLVMITLGFGGALEHTRCLEVIVEALLKRIRRFGSMQAAATGTAIARWRAIPTSRSPCRAACIRPPTVAKAIDAQPVARARGRRHPGVPPRAGERRRSACHHRTGLGIAEGNFQNLLYIPLALACWMSPVIGVFYGYMGWFLLRASEIERERWHKPAKRSRRTTMTTRWSASSRTRPQSSGTRPAGAATCQTKRRLPRPMRAPTFWRRTWVTNCVRARAASTAACDTAIRPICRAKRPTTHIRRSAAASASYCSNTSR